MGQVKENGYGQFSGSNLLLTPENRALQEVRLTSPWNIALTQQIFMERMNWFVNRAVSLEKWLAPGLWQGKYEMTSEHTIVPESKMCSENDEELSEGHRT